MAVTCAACALPRPPRLHIDLALSRYGCRNIHRNNYERTLIYNEFTLTAVTCSLVLLYGHKWFKESSGVKEVLLCWMDRSRPPLSENLCVDTLMTRAHFALLVATSTKQLFIGAVPLIVVYWTTWGMYLRNGTWYPLAASSRLHEYKNNSLFQCCQTVLFKATTLLTKIQSHWWHFVSVREPRLK